MKILLTGFEPFNQSSVNPSELLVQRLGSRAFTAIDLCTAVLPVDRQSAPLQLIQVLEANHPEAVLCLGQAGRRARLSIERVAVNLLDFEIADNAGEQVQDVPVVPGGPAAYFATLPVRRLLRTILEAGVPAELSLSAGSFLCNQVFYSLMHYLDSQRLDIPAGFIHLPFLPEQAIALPGSAAPSMSLETMQTGIEAALLELARDPSLN